MISPELGRNLTSRLFSSAHVYLRMPVDMVWEAIPEVLLQDLGQLTKANSIEGNKKSNIQIIYTPWSNIKVSGTHLRAAWNRS